MKDTERLTSLVEAAKKGDATYAIVSQLQTLLDEARLDELEAAIQQFLFGADNFSKYADARTRHLSKLKQEGSTK